MADQEETTSPYVQGGTCLVHQPRAYDGQRYEVPETIFLARTFVEDGQLAGIARLGPIPDDDVATITGDGTPIGLPEPHRLPARFRVRIYADTPQHRQLLRYVQEQENVASALETALAAIAALRPDQMSEPLRDLLKKTGRYI